MKPPPLTQSAYSKEDLAKVKSFIAGKKILVVDKSPSIRTSIAKALCQLGAVSSDIPLCASFEDGMRSIETGEAIDALITDYNIEARYGLELVNAFREKRKKDEAPLCILITANSTQSAVAEAAEGEVDGYILKPFTADSLFNYLARTILERVKPSHYQKKIREGSLSLTSGDLDAAITKLAEAKTMSPTPSLACYYLGRVYENKSQPALSEREYLEGLTYNAKHYRCSLALFDQYVSQNHPEKAYAIISGLSATFPLSPPRLIMAVQLAVRTQNYKDIPKYHETFIALDEWREELKRSMCAALVIGGKYFLRKYENQEALEFFRKAVASSGGQLSVIREVVISLASAGFAEEARIYLNRIPGESHGTSAYLISKFVICNAKEELGVIIRDGRQLLQNGCHDPLVYRIMIQRSVEAGYESAAERLLSESCSRFPSHAEDFKKAMKSAAPKP